MSISAIVNITYLIGALAFVIGLRRLSSPDTARTGNSLAAFGMGIAIIATIFYPLEDPTNNYAWIGGAMIVGAIIGWIAAKKVKMTDMPQMVSIFNGLGGACAVALAGVEFFHYYNGVSEMATGARLIALLALLIGAVSFTGSLFAYAKLQGLVNDKKVTFKGHNIFNMIILVVLLIAAVMIVVQGNAAVSGIFLVLLIVSMFYGLSFVAPIGGADMPVVISLLNSFTGLSAAAAGLMYGNQIMLIGGIFVGAAGTILTVLMCNAMNRSLINVIIGGFGASAAGAKGGGGDQSVKEVSISDAAIQLYYAQSVVFVPGYGLAVAQAQKVLKELDDLLESNGVDVKYAIHPVAGRMPGHMNVLLAESDVPYPKLLDLEEANAAFKNADTVVVVGANDVVNPAAEDDPSSSIYGMPILSVWDAKNIIVMKRSMSPGYAGIQNQLFFHAKNKMLFGDAKASIQKLVTEAKTL